MMPEKVLSDMEDLLDLPVEMCIPLRMVLTEASFQQVQVTQFG